MNLRSAGSESCALRTIPYGSTHFAHLLREGRARAVDRCVTKPSGDGYAQE